MVLNVGPCSGTTAIARQETVQDLEPSFIRSLRDTRLLMKQWEPYLGLSSSHFFTTKVVFDKF